MSGLDWLLVVVVLLSVALAAAQGFLFEVISLAGVAVGYLLAAWEYPRVAAWYAPYVKAPWVADIAGFLTIFVAVVLLVAAWILTSRMTSNMPKDTSLFKTIGDGITNVKEQFRKN